MPGDVDLQQGAGLILLQQISGGLEALSKDMRDVRERLIRIESQGAIERIEHVEQEVADLRAAHDARINALEADRDRRTGMTTLAGWVMQNGRMIVAFVLGAVAFAFRGHLK